MSDDKPACELIPVAAARFTQAVLAVPKNNWRHATPCSEWNVRDVVNHLTSEHRWAPHVLGGETVQEVGDRYDGDVLGDDPVGAWQEAAAGSLSAFGQVHSDEALVHVSSGQIPTGEYASQMLVDLAVHCWDVARGAGVDERLNPETVAAALTYAQRSASSDGVEGLFAPPVEIDSDDPQDRLLALLGRDPR